jgi:FkbM family methyltransferase
MAREVTVDCQGVWFRLDLRDDVQREIFFNIYEQEDLQQALDLIPSGGTCIDVGANNGAFALRLAKKVGELGVVHALEPDPDILARLETNCRLNGFESFVKCHALAVSNANGSVPFYGSDHNHSGWGSLAKFEDIAAGSRAVKTVTLDSFLAAQRIGRVDFLKVDVEAHEPELLEGARASLMARVFRYILIEFNGIRLAQRGKSLEDVVTPLAAAGYKATRIRVELLQKMQDGLAAPENICTNFLFEIPGQ